MLFALLVFLVYFLFVVFITIVPDILTHVTLKFVRVSFN